MGDPPPTIRIGNGAGFWGDNLDAPFLLARDGRLDVLTLEYLAELTLAILSHLRVKDPGAGYVNDFPELLSRLLPLLQEQSGLKVVTNAGGLNASACALRCARIFEEAGRGAETIGVVYGDDILGSIGGWLKGGMTFDHMETGRPIEDVVDRLVCANVYLGAGSIAGVLGEGARIAITGRVADASLTLGPAQDHFGWGWSEWGKLAGASVAGHLIECGAQATGGLWHEWEQEPDLSGIGYPIAEVAADGSCVITKPERSGGLVSVGTISEQLVYEIDDPSRYRTPDVDVDLTTVELAQEATNRVSVRNAQGRAPSDTLKAAAVYRDGWTASGMVAVVGRDAVKKGRAAGQLVLDRVKRAGFSVAESLVECIGGGDVAPDIPRAMGPVFEVMLRVTVRDENRAAVERFCREMAPLVTSGPPGIAGYASGRPSARPAFGYWPALVARSLIEERTIVRTASEWLASKELK